MSGAPPDPDWDKLPHNPEAFFGLSGDYDRKELKRRYNRLLRQFKPEKHPDEFRRIRSAYEQLDNRLRYGAPLSRLQPEQERYTWNIPDGAGRPDSPDGDPSDKAEPRQVARPAPKPLHERLKTESPEAIFAEVKAVADKQPYHFYALAVLSDGLEQSVPQGFVKWILRGLKSFPHDVALLQLLRSYIRHIPPDEQVAGLLTAVSQVIRDERFYSLTEPLWDRLLQQAPFSRFRAVLARCEENVVDYQVIRKLTFYIHILKRAMWSADDDWTDEKFDFLEQHYQEIPGVLDYDVEVLLHLREYQRLRGEFRSGHPLRALVDKTIETCCTSDDVDADRAFLDCQVRLTAAGRDVLDAFPAGDNSEALNTFTALWLLMNYEYGDRLAASEDALHTLNIFPVLMEIEAKTDRSSLGRMWNFSMRAYGIWTVLIYGLIFLTLYVPAHALFGENDGPVFLALLGCVAVAGIGGWTFNRYIGRRLWANWCRRTAEKCYHNIWRVELQQVMSRTFVPYRDLIHIIYNPRRKQVRLTCESWIPAFVGNDPGLAIYSSAQRYLI